MKAKAIRKENAVKCKINLYKSRFTSEIIYSEWSVQTVKFVLWEAAIKPRFWHQALNNDPVFIGKKKLKLSESVAT